MSQVEDVIRAWDWSGFPELRRGLGGLINATWSVDLRSSGKLNDSGPGLPVAVLQRLNTQIFSPNVHYDIEAVTAHLEGRGFCTPRLRRTREGTLWHTASTGEVWRVLSWVGDRTIDKLTDPQLARSAGRLVAQFHQATVDFGGKFRSSRGTFHDTELRMTELEEALAQEVQHRHHSAVSELARDILAMLPQCGGISGLPSRVIHGDLKISNLRFSGDTAVALVDLDTLGRGTLDAELGDALRSWCNPAREEEPEVRFDLDLFESALTGYAEGGAAQWINPEEREAIVPGVLRITLELASRFAADALRERYFGWDPAFGSRGDHNLCRARGQLALANALSRCRIEAEQRLRRAFGR